VDTCLHWPMDFQYFEPNASLEEKILLASVQVMEDIKNDGENLAAGGWQMVCIFFQLGQIKKLSNGNGEHDVVQASLGSIKFAKRSELKTIVQEKGGRSMKEALIVHSRIVSNNVVHILTRAKVIYIIYIYIYVCIYIYIYMYIYVYAFIHTCI
jgi:hypothetical protein